MDFTEPGPTESDSRPDMSAVSQQIQRLEHGLEQLTLHLDRHETAVGSALGPVPDKRPQGDAQAGGAVRPPESALTNALRSCNDTLEAAVRSLRSITSRLEL